MNRFDFIKGAAAVGAMAAVRGVAFGDAERGSVDRDAFQREIDAITPKTWDDYYTKGTDATPDDVTRTCAEFPALGRYEDAFDKVVAEIKSVKVTGRPAVWLVYNMGVIVKTANSLFAIDLQHRRAEELAPLLDFALITHNHGDHYTQRFYRAMNNQEHKTVVSNFLDNYGASRGGGRGGYTRAVKTFSFGDVTVRTTYTDHNAYLLDFTTAFEISIGNFTIYHSGDCSNAAKLRPTCPNPDLWFFHPYCGMKPVDGAQVVNPKLAVVAHLNELGHAKDRWRWTWAQGDKAKALLEAAGFNAVVPLWGDRIA